jgi:hypothetical protein
MNEYFHGKGPIGPDIDRSEITGFWYLRGSS